MASFVRPPAVRRLVPWRRPAVAVALLLVLSAGALATARAIDYHPTYLERTERQSHDGERE
jgi:hypothetical protein